MAVLFVALGLGLLVFFVGLSLISIHRKEEEVIETNEAADEERRELKEEELAPPSPEQNRTYRLGLLFGIQGFILSALAAAALLINGLAIKIPWYFSLPALLCYLAAVFIYDSLKIEGGE